MKTLEEVSDSLYGHIGTTGYYQFKDDVYVMMTSGMLDFVQKSKSGWIIDFLNTDTIVAILQEHISTTGMIVVKIESDGQAGTILILEDGDYNLLWDGALIEKTLPGEFSFWLEPMEGKLVALLPSEH